MWLFDIRASRPQEPQWLSLLHQLLEIGVIVCFNGSEIGCQGATYEQGISIGKLIEQHGGASPRITAIYERENLPPPFCQLRELRPTREMILWMTRYQREQNAGTA
jgi:hypothetical protein